MFLIFHISYFIFRWYSHCGLIIYIWNLQYALLASVN